ncbi:uncharacterized protein LOC131649878 [Vicia villosa]|uniref:uncharacterized protein LOC131649878 n=1 Tax=Vicia villosa TaxID=3911 RepID=UPI00273CECF3|nr:uncharacterized protein LOC131649878 [Vicia villosa]
MRVKKDKLIISCERGRNYKKKVVVAGNYTMKMKCPFIMRSMPSGSGWKVMVKCGFHSHILANDLNGNDILVRLKDHERNFINDMTKYNMAHKYIVDALKDTDPKNLTSITQVYKAGSAYNESKRGSLTKIQHLQSLIHEDKYMYWTRNMNSFNVIADIFLTHLDSVKLLKI